VPAHSPPERCCCCHGHTGQQRAPRSDGNGQEPGSGHSALSSRPERAGIAETRSARPLTASAHGTAHTAGYMTAPDPDAATSTEPLLRRGRP
jgi:hypothetical protein